MSVQKESQKMGPVVSTEEMIQLLESLATSVFGNVVPEEVMNEIQEIEATGLKPAQFKKDNKMYRKNLETGIWYRSHSME